MVTKAWPRTTIFFFDGRDPRDTGSVVSCRSKDGAHVDLMLLVIQSRLYRFNLVLRMGPPEKGRSEEKRGGAPRRMEIR